MRIVLVLLFHSFLQRQCRMPHVAQELAEHIGAAQAQADQAEEDRTVVPRPAMPRATAGVVGLTCALLPEAWSTNHDTAHHTNRARSQPAAQDGGVTGCTPIHPHHMWY